MEGRLYLDVHVIQTVPPSCVNRDDTGSPKTAIYGGVRRARVSSQSWKRAVRAYFKENSGDMLGIRTAHVVEMVADAISAKDQTVPRDVAMEKAAAVFKAGKISIKSKKIKDKEEVDCSAALMFVSRLQINLLANLALSPDFAASEAKAQKAAVNDILDNNNTADIILFGRMLADDPSLNVDATCQVAHAISTHRVDNEYDYYTAVDEMNLDDTSGAGMIGTVEFNSSTLYRYATLAVHELANQMTEKSDILRTVTEFVKAFVLSMPTGKQNTFANRTVPDAVLFVLRKDQPVNLVGAFEVPVKAGSEGYALPSAKRLTEYMSEVCSSFVCPAEKTWQIGKGLDGAGAPTGLTEALEDISRCIDSEI